MIDKEGMCVLLVCWSEPSAEEIEIGDKDVKYPCYIVGFAVLVSLAGSCANTADNAPRQQTVSPRTVEVVATATKTEESLGANAATQPGESSVPPTYQVLKGPWWPYEAPQGLGLEILISESASQEGIIRLLKELGAGKDPVSITVWTSRQAWEDANRDTYGDLYDEHLICVYTKNTTIQRAYFGADEVKWMQEKGRFSHLFGQTTPMK